MTIVGVLLISNRPRSHPDNASFPNSSGSLAKAVSPNMRAHPAETRFPGVAALD